jgi:hypothetical protein
MFIAREILLVLFVMYKMGSTSLCSAEISYGGKYRNEQCKCLIWGEDNINHFTPHDHVWWKLNENLH